MSKVILCTVRQMENACRINEAMEWVREWAKRTTAEEREPIVAASIRAVEKTGKQPEAWRVAVEIRKRCEYDAKRKETTK